MISFIRANLRETLRTVGILLLAAVTAAAWFALVQSHRTPPASDYVSPSTLTPPAPTPTSSETDEQAEESAEATVVAFLGDSYTAGIGASEADNRWTTLLAEAAGWSEQNFGAEGTGYVAAPFINNEQSVPYTARVEAIIAENPEVVIVSGGRNDVGQDTAEVQAAASEIFTSLREALPDVTIIVIEPWWDSTNEPFGFAEVADAVRTAAQEAGVTYIETGEVLSDPSLISADGVNPNDDGYRAIADAISGALGGL